MLSFLGLGPESPALQLYGKLPIAKDYLRIGCGEGSGRELRAWLDRTFGSTQGETRPLELGEAWRFLGQGTKEPLQGCLWPSHDAGELRSFPFTAFVTRKRKALVADLAAGLAQAEGVWRLLAETREECLAAEDGRQMLERLRGRELAIGSGEGVDGDAADFDAWVATIWPEERTDGLLALARRVRELARSGYRGPFRMPLARELPLRDQVLAWTAWLRDLGVLAHEDVPTSFFPPRALVPPASLGFILLARGPLSDAQVRWLTEPAGSEALGAGDFSIDLDAGAADVPAPSESRVKLRESLREALASAGLGAA